MCILLVILTIGINKFSDYSMENSIRLYLPECGMWYRSDRLSFFPLYVYMECEMANRSL